MTNPIDLLRDLKIIVDPSYHLENMFIELMKNR